MNLSMNPGIELLQPYPFEKLAELKRLCRPPTNIRHIDLAIGEPKHTTPRFILDALAIALPQVSSYPGTRGNETLRKACADWLIQRFKLPADSIDYDKHILPVNGTREALFAIAQCMINNTTGNPVILIPNPFYQIYEGAALLAGAVPCYVNCSMHNNFLPDFSQVPEHIWQSCELLYLCSPNNPTGKVMDEQNYLELFQLADKYEFLIAADECYSEIYFNENEPPQGLLQAAASNGRSDYHRCIVFHSLSKRSNVPGMRSGFVAGDKEIIDTFYKYRTYHGCTMPPYVQAASASAWQDEEHVITNRDQYREKFDAVLSILKPVLDVSKPEAAFYLWPEIPISDTLFARNLYEQHNVTVLPGSFLSRTIDGFNPGENRIRIALVASLEQCVDAAQRIRAYISDL